MLYILKNSGTLTENYHPIWEDFHTLQSILDKMKIAGFDEAKRIQYEKDMYDERRRNGEIAAAEEEGRKAVAINMLAAGMPVEKIAELTELSVEEITALRSRM